MHSAAHDMPAVLSGVLNSSSSVGQHTTHGVYLLRGDYLITGEQSESTNSFNLAVFFNWHCSVTGAETLSRQIE